MEGIKRCNDILCEFDGAMQTVSNFYKTKNGYESKCKKCRARIKRGGYTYSTINSKTHKSEVSLGMLTKKWTV